MNQIVRIRLKGSDIELEYDPLLPKGRTVPEIGETDDVTWQAEGKIVKWVVDFCPGNTKGGVQNPSGRRSPFKGKRVSASGLNGRKTEKPEKGAGGGKDKKSTFSYAIAVLDDRGGLHALDPDVRVRGGPG